MTRKLYRISMLLTGTTFGFFLLPNSCEADILRIATGFLIR